jgi:hypothetical protein
MRNQVAIAFLTLLAAAAPAVHAEDNVIDFEQAEIGKPAPEWIEKGVVFKLAGQPTQSRAVGRIMFFPHLATDHKGLLNAMATEQSIPVQATFPKNVAAVTVVFWASTGCPAFLEALDAKGSVVDRASIDAAPQRKSPADPVPVFELKVKAPGIAAIRYGGPRNGEFLAADEIRFTTVAAD